MPQVTFEMIKKKKKKLYRNNGINNCVLRMSIIWQIQLYKYKNRLNVNLIESNAHNIKVRLIIFKLITNYLSTEYNILKTILRCFIIINNSWI